MLTFDVHGQTLIRTDKFEPATDSVNYLMAQFSFKTKDWTGNTKTALFRLGETSYPAILDTDGKCIVPWEALVHGDGQYARKNGSTIFVSLVGEAGTTRIPTDEVAVKLKSSGYGDTETPEDPTEGVYQQIMANLGTIQEDVTFVKNNSGNAVKGVKTGAVVGMGDVSPLYHNVKVKVSGVGDPTAVTITQCGKNLLNIEHVSETINGVTFTVNDDGSIKVVGTATGTITKFIAVNFPNMVTGEKYVLNGCPVGGTVVTYSLRFIGMGDSTYTEVHDEGAGVSFEFLGYDSQYSVAICIHTGVVMNHTFYPMVRHVSVEDDAFDPYILVATDTPDADGTTTDFISRTSGMTFLTNVEGAVLEVEYHQDINTALDGKAGNGAVIVNMTLDSGKITAIDKTFADTLAAFLAGRQIECRVDAGYDGWYVLSPVRVYGTDGIVFSAHSGNTGAVWTTVTFLNNDTATFTTS